MATIGIIGLGLVGSALAERLHAAGHSVTGFDIELNCCERLLQIGGQPLASAQEVAASSEICLLSLPTSAIAEDVLVNLDSSLAGKIVIDTTTGDPETMARIGQELSARSAHYLDATIVGSSKQVLAGDVLVLVGGAETAFSRCRELLECFARQIFFLGPVGSGARMKLVVNLVLGLNRAVLAEGLIFAQACGIDSAQALEILRAGMAYSRVMDTKGHKMLQRDFSVEARLSQHRKDVGLILQAASAANLPLPLSQLHDELLSAAESAGFGAADNSAIITAFEPREIHRRTPDNPAE